ncbi:unnamed protein product [Prorocentrum cordatum]|uniref:Kinesin motor domain-containing protein n=1 Tax=Prorocentrum cordatum TaxID=2364126 RepID=A0ABN9U1M1_9DINO|nr:unnamed protein product [Polarella glacialis]
MAANVAGSSVTVCVRLRPFLPRERRQQAVAHVNGNTVNILEHVDQLYGEPKTEQRQFVFDVCLGTDTGQAILYERIGQHTLQNALAGPRARPPTPRGERPRDAAALRGERVAVDQRRDAL